MEGRSANFKDLLFVLMNSTSQRKQKICQLPTEIIYIHNVPNTGENSVYVFVQLFTVLVLAQLEVVVKASSEVDILPNQSSELAFFQTFLEKTISLSVFYFVKYYIKKKYS